MLCSVAMDMGCGSSKGAVVVDTNKGIVKYVDIIKELSMHHLPRRDVSFEEASEMQTKDVNEMWAIVQKTSDKEPIHVEPVKNRKGWRTIRIFVSSTFKDFQQEREVLVKEVFPDLRLWCEQRKLRLVECDLRWGVPKDSTTEETIKICLSELDRCYEDNVAPFFLNLAGERTGWIPKSSDITQNLAAQYGWVYGLSVTEMEIVHGAFRKLNPNAIFMFRDRDSLNDLPDEVREDFIDTDDHCIEKVKVLKEMIKKTFPEKNIYHYKVQGRMEDENAIMDGLSGDSKFSKMVYDFFKTRIEELYPLDTRPRNFLQAQREAHETFLDNWSRCVLGRDKMIDEVKCYINSNTTHSSLVIIGTAGAGKSAVMAKCASDAMHMFYADEISGEQKKWRVFFHFVGATPGSTDLAFFLQRLTKEVKPDLKDIVSDLETLIQLSNSLLSNPNTEPVILFIDAVNQLDEDKQLLLRRWLPENLSSNVRVVVSTTKNTQSHEMLKMYKPHPAEIICGALNVDSRKEIVHNFLKIYNKQLDDEQLDKLLLKQGSSNPLWLSIACEELRVFGNFEKLIGKIESLPNELISLEIEVISRFEAETDALLMKATLCLLEVSRHGLLETELLALLGDDSSIKCPEYVEGAFIPIKGDADFFINGGSTLFKPPKTKNSAKVTRQKSKLIKFLPARDWAIIYRNLKQLLRPCGDLGEGRLDFYHRSLSKAVRQMYFKGCEDYETQMYHYWHEVLAEYFEHNDGDVDRKAEELPFHLEYLLDTNRLMRCLLDWPLFNKLYNEDFSIDLLGSWQKAGGYAVAAALYKESLLLLSESGMPLSELADQMEKVAMFLIQAGQYSDALSLLEKRIQYENEKLGERVDKLADIYQLMALCKSEVVKQHPLMYKYMYRFLYKSQLVEHRKVVELLRKTNTYREKLDGEQQKFKIAVNNILLCFHLTIMSTLDVNSAGEYREEGLNVINEAMEFFEKTNDLGHLSDAIMTKTFMNANATFDEKKKQLEKAFVLSLRAYGKGHSMYIRICISIGLLHERSGDYYTAYEYFTEWKNAAREIYGPNHIKSIRSNETLDSPMYKRIKEEKEREESS